MTDDVSSTSGLLGRTATREFVVSGADTAAAVGSGDLAVLGTPVLVAWCEATTCAALALPAGSTSVGTRVALDHLAASPVGAVVRVEARVTAVDGRRLTFAVEAYAPDHSGPGADEPVGRGDLVGRGEVHRVIVDAERFLARL